jgi:hypothetical protein
LTYSGHFGYFHFLDGIPSRCTVLSSPSCQRSIFCYTYVSRTWQVKGVGHQVQVGDTTDLRNCPQQYRRLRYLDCDGAIRGIQSYRRSILTRVQEELLRWAFTPLSCLYHTVLGGTSEPRPFMRRALITASALTGHRSSGVRLYNSVPTRGESA